MSDLALRKPNEESDSSPRFALSPDKVGDMPERALVVQAALSVSRITERTGNTVHVQIVSEEETERLKVSDLVDEIVVERVPVNRFVEARTPASFPER